MDGRQSERRSKRARAKIRRAVEKWRGVEALESRWMLAADVVISEFMFHPSSGDDGEEYVELYNKGDASANLSGWTFDKGVDYTFGARTLTPGQYLVVAADILKFNAKYPAATNVVGNWAGSLSNGGEEIQLTDNLGATVDSVNYADDGNWGVRERGRGVDLVGSLTSSGTTATVTLFDHGYVNGDTVQILGADQAEYNGTFVIGGVTNTTFTYTMASNPADNTATGFILSRHLIDRGNSGWSWVSFADGLGKSLELINPTLGNNDGQNWAASNTLQGTPGAGNSVASANVAPLITSLSQTPLIPKSSDVVTVSAELKDETPGSISATLKWRVDSASGGTFNSVAMHDDGVNGDALAGDGVWSGQIPAQANNAVVEYYISASDGTNTRTYSAPAVIPGVESLVRSANVVTGTTTMAHGMLPGDTITISGASPASFNGTFVIATVPSATTFTYSLSGSNTTATVNGTLKAQSANRLYQVDNTVYSGQQMLFKEIMRASEATYLSNLAHGSGTNSNATMNATLVAVGPDGTEARYNIGIRNRGGGSRNSSISNYHIDLLDDHTWSGVTSLNFNAVFSMEDVLGSAIMRAAGLPVQNVVPAQVRVNNVNLASSGSDMFGSYSWLESEDSNMVADHFPLDKDGNYYRAVDPGHSATLAYLGANPASYLTAYHLQTNTQSPDYTDIINLTKAFDATQTPDPAFVAAMNANINVEEWMRYLAASILLGDQETTLASGVGDDYDLYRGAIDQRFVVVPHDLDTILGRSDGSPQTYNGMFQSGLLGSMRRLLRNPTFAPMYAEQMKDLIDTTFSAPNIGALIENTLASYGSAISQGVKDGMKTFVANRITSILSPNSGNPPMPLKLSVTSAPAAVNGYPQVTANSATLSGQSNAILTRSVLVNGVAATWTAGPPSGTPTTTSTMGNWTVTLTNLHSGINRVLIQSLDGNSNEVERTYQDIWYDTGAMTTVTGTLPAGTTTWTAAGGPYHVTGTVTVNAGSTLIIQPGTTVFFDAGQGLTINGGLLTAIGTDLARIRFNKTPTAASAWRDLFVTAASYGVSTDSKIGYLDLDGAGSGGDNIRVTNAKLDIDHVNWFNAAGQIVDFNDSSFRLTNSVIPTVSNVEGCHFDGMPSGGYALVQGNIFGTTTGHSDIFDFTGGNRPGSIFQVLDNIFTGTGTGFVEADDILDIDGTDAHIEGNVFMNVYPSSTSDTNSAISGGSNAGSTSEIVSVRNIFYNVDHAFLMKEGNSVRSVNDTIVHVITGVYNFNEPGFAASAGVGGYGDGIIMQDVPLDGSGNALVVQNAGTSPFVLRNSIMPGNTPYTGTGNLVGDPQMFIRNTSTHTVSGITRSGSIATATSSGHGFVQGDSVLVYGSGPTQYAGVFTVTNATEDTFSFVVSGTPANTTAAMFAVRQPALSEFGLRPGPGPAVGKGPNGTNMGSSNPSGATISGEPVSPTFSQSATLTVGGPDIMAYKWKLDNGAWSAEVLVTNPLTTNPTIPPINLSGLANGAHTVYVVRKNSAGFYQADAAATASKTWTVNTALAAHVRINEVLAANVAAANHSGTFPDMIELYNDGKGSIDLSGMRLTDDQANITKYTFPAGTPLLAQGAFLVVYADSAATSGIHTGFSLKQSGEGVYLYNSVASGGAQIDGVTFGTQLDDLSISRQNDGTWKLSNPTFGVGPNFPGAVNTALPLGDPHQLKINEWGAHGIPPFSKDFVEIYNPSTWAVDMGGLSLSDQPIGDPGKSPIPALTFIKGKGFFAFTADGDPQQGADHADFHLSSERGDIGLFDAAGNQIDFIVYETQELGLSEGRTPDGDPHWQKFAPPNPGVSNPAEVSNPVSSQTLVNFGSSWKFSDAGGDLGAAWRTDTPTPYNDSAWVSGNGIFGTDADFAAGTFATAINLGPSGARTPTVYFRTHFTFNGDVATVQSLLLETKLDDGAIVYLNGQQIFSLGIPNGTITYSTYTGATAPGRNVDNFVTEGPFTIPMNSLPAGTLKVGDNILQVEVHQTSATSGDLVWDGKLSAVIPGVPPVVPALRITEINYNPVGGGTTYSPSDFEFIELKNVGSSTINLAGIHFGAGVTLNFASGSLAVGASGVIVKNQAAFTSRYGTGINILGVYTDSLDNNGEEIRLLDASNNIIQDFAYSDSWYPTTDGAGYTLMIVNPLADPTAWISPDNWKASKFVFGSPVLDESTTAVDVVVVNEISTNSAPGTDWVELKNTTASPINIGGWYLTDAADNLLKYRIAPGTMIQGNSFMTFDESQFNTASPVAFTFSEYGEDVYLSSSTTAGVLTGYHQGLSYGPAENGVTFGRYQTSTGQVDFPPLSSATKTAANSVPKAGPIAINELMYHPDTTEGEFIELKNISGSTVALGNWKFTSGIEFTIPAGTSLTSGALLLVVDQDPATFRTTYGVPAGVQILQYVGALNNAGDNLVLAKPGPADPGTGFVPYYQVDRVEYGTTPPWPITPDGQGPSLSRVDTQSYGNDPINWAASTQVGGTPGQANSGLPPFVLEGTAGADTFYVRRNGTNIEVFAGSTPTGSPAYTVALTVGSFTFNGNAGDDKLIVDFVNGSPIPSGGMSYAGGTQTSSDTLTVMGGSGPSSTGTYTPTAGVAGAGVVSVGGGNISFSGLEPVTASAFATFTMITPSANDTLTLDGPISGQTRISGSSGGTTFESISFTGVTNFILDTGANDGGAGTDVIFINGGTAATGLFALHIQLGTGTNTVHVNGGTSALDVSTSGTGTVAIDVINSATANFMASQRFTTLTVGGTATARLAAGGSKFIRTSNLSIGSTATLDLTDNDLIYQSSAAAKQTVYAAILGMLQTGRNGGAWNGKGLSSSSAAVAANRATGLAGMINDTGDGVTTIRTTLAGEPVDVNTILVKYTYNGDGNLDGEIDPDDFALIDGGFAGGMGGYYHGDFNYSGGAPDADDYFQIDKAYSSQGAVLGGGEVQAAGSEVLAAPEPPPASADAPMEAAATRNVAVQSSAASPSDSDTMKKTRKQKHHHRRRGVRDLSVEQKDDEGDLSAAALARFSRKTIRS